MKLYYLILQKKKYNNLFLTGLIGFKGLKNNGCAEIGYAIFKSFERKGLMSNALNLMINWAFQHNECLKITASGVWKTNLGSIKILNKNGFKKTSENEHQINFELLKNQFK